METLPKKLPSSRGGRDGERDRAKDRDRDRDRNHRRSRHDDRDRDRDRNRARDRDGDRKYDHDRRRNDHRRPTSPAERQPKPPPSGRSRPSSKNNKGEDKGKGSESVRNGELESGEIRFKMPQIGDDFVPLVGSDTDGSSDLHEKPQSERARQKVKVTVRDWDVGKRSSMGDGGVRGTKRKYDSVMEDEDDRGYRRRERFDPYDTRKTPWVSRVNWTSCRNVAELLHREVEAFVNYMSPTPVEDEIRGLVIQLVSKAISGAFPDACILPFGSYETKLYLPSGDIDLVIDSYSMACNNKTHVLYALANTLKRSGITSKVTVISKAKVPIIKFVTHYGRLNVDISINQGNGVKAGRIVNGFLQDMGGCGFALRCLIVIAKAFLNQRGMNEVFSGGLGSYSIVCMAISFLQMHPKIRRGEIEPDKNLGVLVMEFFELYGSYFNYEEVGISVKDGGSYFSKKERGWYDSTNAFLLSIEDPTDMANDISKGSYAIRKVRQTLAGAFEIMQAVAYMRAGILNSRRDGQSYSLRAETNAADTSILSSILGVTQETINNRRLLQEVYENRSLHKLLQVSPQASVVTADMIVHTDRNGKSSAGGMQGWDADMELESDDEAGHDVAERGNSESDERGRYDIQERCPTRSGTSGTGRCDPLTTYTTDESEDELEDQAYGNAGLDGGEQSDRVDRVRLRSYWLSKGIGPPESDEEDGVVIVSS